LSSWLWILGGTSSAPRELSQEAESIREGDRTFEAGQDLMDPVAAYLLGFISGAIAIVVIAVLINERKQ
jgi:hypothetical protein